MPNGMERRSLSLSLSLQCSMVGIAGDRYVGNILKPPLPYFFFDSAVPKEKQDSHHCHMIPNRSQVLSL